MRSGRLEHTLTLSNPMRITLTDEDGATSIVIPAGKYSAATIAEDLDDMLAGWSVTIENGEGK